MIRPAGKLGRSGRSGQTGQVGREGRESLEGLDGAALAAPLHVTLTHHKLVAWQRADDLFVAVHKLTARFPPDERFGLVSQMRRAAYSVPANIVEGMARRSLKDRLRFLNVAEASLAELAYCLHASRRLGYKCDDEYASLERAAFQVGAPLAGLVRSLKPIPERE